MTPPVELPRGVRIRGRVVRRDAPAVDVVLLEETVRTRHDAEVGIVPDDAVRRFRIADVTAPVGLVPQAEALLHGIPPEAAVRGAGQVDVGILGRRPRRRERLHARARPHERRVDLDGLVPVARDAVGLFHEVVVHEQLPPDVDADRRGVRADRGGRQNEGNAEVSHS